MELGTTIPHTGRLASADFVRDFCIAAEESGWAGLWAVDHLVMPRHTDSLYTLAREPAEIGVDAIAGLLAPNFEMMSTLLWVAGLTRRIKLGTGVAVLTIRNPVLNARQLATLDVYSGGGRVLHGAGVGWLAEEAHAMNMPWDHRGERADEHIELMRALWSQPDSEFEWHGPYFDLPPMDPRPQPVAPIPILIGGHSEPALDRAARLGDGWIAASMSPERFVEHRDRLFARCEAHDRDPEELMLVNSTRLSGPHTDLDGARAEELAGRLRRFAELGVDHLQVTFDQPDRAAAIATLHALGRDVLPAI
jgi:probable F420-dependent oxidoreductase